MALQGNFATTIKEAVESLTTADMVNINEAIFQETWGVSNFVQAHSLRTGVRNGGVIPIVLDGNVCSMPVGNELSCTLNDCDLTIDYDNKIWDLSEYNCRHEICFRNVDEDWLVFWNAYRQRLDDPTQAADMQAVITFLTKNVEEKISNTQWTAGYFGDQNSVSSYLNGSNGYYVQALAGNGHKVELTSAGAEPTGQELLEQIIAAIEEFGTDFWMSQPDVVIKMSYAAAFKISTYLNSLDRQSPYNCDCINVDGLVSSSRFFPEGLRILGIPVESHRDIDAVTTCINGLDKYQILIARKSNLLIGTNTTDKLEGFDMFFDRKDRTVIIDAMVYMGVAIPLDEYIILSAEVGS